jgi:hypothetical protein
VLHEVPDAIGPPDLAPVNGPPESLAGDKPPGASSP